MAMATRRRRYNKSARLTRIDVDARERALEAIQRMRSEKASLTAASKQVQTTRATVLRYARSALKRARSGRYAVTQSDRLARHLWFHTESGKIEITVRGSRPAERVARYMAAADLYLRSGDDTALREFEGETIRAGKTDHAFLTDRDALERLAFAGEISFDRLYTMRA
jgi:hypothetical protein